MTVLAHAGHWLVQLLYAAPVVVLAGAVGWSRLQDRRRRRAQAASQHGPRP